MCCVCVATKFMSDYFILSLFPLSQLIWAPKWVNVCVCWPATVVWMKFKLLVRAHQYIWPLTVLKKKIVFIGNVHKMALAVSCKKNEVFCWECTSLTLLNSSPFSWAIGWYRCIFLYDPAFLAHNWAVPLGSAILSLVELDTQHQVRGGPTLVRSFSPGCWGALGSPLWELNTQGKLETHGETRVGVHYGQTSACQCLMTPCTIPTLPQTDELLCCCAVLCALPELMFVGTVGWTGPEH